MLKKINWIKHATEGNNIKTETSNKNSLIKIHFVVGSILKLYTFGGTHRTADGDFGGVTGKANDTADDDADMHDCPESAEGVTSPCPFGAPAPPGPGDSLTLGRRSGSRI